VQGAVDYLEQELGRPPTLAEIGAELGLEAEDVAEALEVGGVRRAVVSLDAGVGDDESMTFVDVVGGDDPAQALAEDELFVDALVHSLPEAERDVVVLSYFGNMSQREVGSRLGKSQMQVSRTKERALERLRRRVAVAS
jgi:RNA polymerase sigma-B factor